jgi:cytochrome P450
LMARARERRRRPRDGTSAAPGNLLEAMLALRDAPGSTITDDEVAANVLTMLVAGEDTTATTIAWALVYLGSDDDLQQRVARHACEVLGNARVCPTYDAMRALDLCEAVCTEAIRLHPIAPYMSFEPLEEVRLQGIRLPAGTKMFFLNRPSMLDANMFSNPSHYDPWRWLIDQRASINAHEPRAFLQFGAGPRVCPGRHLAAVEMRLVISMLIANFRARLTIDASEISEVCAFTTGPSALPMRLALR